MGTGSALALFCEFLLERVHITDFLHGPVIKTLGFQGRGHRLDP